MCARGSGTLVGIASVAGMRGLPGHAAYSSSKAAAIVYCESLRGEMRPFGVKVVTIAPGYIDTPLTRGNRYAMPFLMSAADFAERAFRAIEAGRSFRFIPWQMGWVARLLKILPNCALRPAARRPAAQAAPVAVAEAATKKAVRFRCTARFGRHRVAVPKTSDQ